MMFASSFRYDDDADLSVIAGIDFVIIMYSDLIYEQTIMKVFKQR